MGRLILALLLALPAAAPAQGPTTGGFLFTYAPEDRGAFESGYRRHLDWHRAQRDSLSWFGWDVLVGPRPGLFVDGIFGVPFGALDVRVDPAGDQADVAANVLPYADPVSREIIALRPDLSSAFPLEEGAPATFVQVVWYVVAPGEAEQLEGALSTLHEEAVGGSLLPYTVYERVAGAEPGFVVMVWRDRLATFDEHRRNPERALRRILGGGISTGDAKGVVRSASSEIWRYRRDLTYLGPVEEEP